MSKGGLHLNISASRSVFNTGVKAQEQSLSSPNHTRPALLLPIESKTPRLFIHESDSDSSILSNEDVTSCSDHTHDRDPSERRVKWKQRSVPKVEYEQVDETSVCDGTSAFVKRIKSSCDHLSVDRVIVYVQEPDFVFENPESFELSQ